jgi:hypothetical protein
VLGRRKHAWSLLGQADPGRVQADREPAGLHHLDLEPVGVAGYVTQDQVGRGRDREG